MAFLSYGFWCCSLNSHQIAPLEVALPASDFFYYDAKFGQNIMHPKSEISASLKKNCAIKVP